jgi:rhodanese-related sulfurtransferase
MRIDRYRAVVALVAALPIAVAAQAPAAKPTIPQICTTCHKAEPGNLRGMFENVAFKSQSIQLKIDANTEIVRFDPKTIKVIDGGNVKPGEALRDIAKNKEARIEYAEKDGAKHATLISFKGPIQIAPDKLVKYEEVERLVALGPEKGSYTLIDSRPLPRVQEGTIPTAINLPYPAFDKFVDRLPKDKNRLTIFFCQGITCVMSPNSMKKAEALGYTNLKVYREGYPEWIERNIGVIAAPHLKEAFIDKGIPHVLIDARPASTAAEGYIPGAVSIPPSQVRAAVATLPAARLAAPIIVYDVDGGASAQDVAQVIKSSGQPNVTVIGGGIDAWKAGKYPVATGAPVTKVAYAPKPRPGSIPNEEFLKYAKATPADVVILDVRNTDEANAGMIKGAKLIPDEELLVRMNELPKDKRIIAHCSTGIRAEMAYHKLKDAGYKAGFVYAELDIKKNGDVKLTPK